MNFDPSQSSDSQSSALEDQPSPSILDYFDSHNVTQVESGNLRNGESEVSSTSSGTNVDTGQNRKGPKTEKTNESKELVRQEGVDFTDDAHNISLENGDIENKKCDRGNSDTFVCDTDFVCNENKNENAQNLDMISEKNLLNVSGRDLHPSLGFEYRPEMRTSTSDISTTGFEYSQTDDVKDVFDNDADVELENSEKQLHQNRSVEECEISLRSTELKTIANVNQSKINNANEAEINQPSTSADEKSDNEFQGHIIISQVGNLNKSDNQSSFTTALRGSTEMNNQTSNALVSPSISLDVENITVEGSHWLNDYKRLGYGAVGLSLGVLALALGIRHIGAMK